MGDMEQWQQQQRMAATYKEKWDEELRVLAAEFADLTPPAQAALRAEMLNRGLGDPLAPAPPPVRPSGVPQGESGDESEVEFSWKTPLCNCETSEQAAALVEALRRAGIESWVEGGSRYSWDINGPRILVGADQLEHAQQIASQPIPQEILDQVRAELAEPEPFQAPSCPGCGAPDPLLLEVEPVNRWQCETCEREWDEPAPPGPPVPADSARN